MTPSPKLAIQFARGEKILSKSVFKKYSNPEEINVPWSGTASPNTLPSNI